MQSDLAIDIGTSNIRIFTAGKGIAVNEPSMIAVDNEEIKAWGQNAYEMLGRISGKKEIISPIKDGVIADFTSADSVPSELTEVEKNAFESLVLSTGIRRAGMIKSTIAAAMGAGIDIESPHGVLIANLGGGMADMSVISLGGTAVTGTVRCAGDAMDNEIIKYIKKTYNIVIGKRTAEQAKINAGSVLSGIVSGTYTIKGKCMITGMPVKVDIDREELVAPLSKTAVIIAEKIKEMLVNTPPELIGDIHNDGIILTGGLSGLRGMDKLIENTVGLKVRVAEEPELCAVKGSGTALSYMSGRKSKINPITLINS